MEIRGAGVLSGANVTEIEEMREGAAKPSFNGDFSAAIPLFACSACAGDYEDPDSTTWTARDEEDRDDAFEMYEDEISASQDE